MGYDPLIIYYKILFFLVFVMVILGGVALLFDHFEQRKADKEVTEEAENIDAKEE